MARTALGCRFAQRSGNPVRAGEERFSFDHYFFGVALADCDFYNDWLWDSDQTVIYEHPDHDGCNWLTT